VALLLFCLPLVLADLARTVACTAPDHNAPALAFAVAYFYVDYQRVLRPEATHVRSRSNLNARKVLQPLNPSRLEVIWSIIDANQ
jgi:hypothetical protein